jgi:flagellar protein FliJ
VARNFSLQVLLEHARHRLEAAERLLRLMGRKEAAARQQLEEIQGYKLEYQRRLAGAGEQGLPIHLLREYHAFLGKVEQAITHQTGEVDKAHANWQAAHDKWLAQRQQVKAYEVLAQRHAHAELVREEKRDQRITDEAASRKSRVLGE